MNIEEFGFDEHGQLIDGWVNPNQCAPAPRHRFWRDRRGFGHWVAQAMGVGAMFVLFNFLWPAAKSMMTSTVSNMTELNGIMVSSLNGNTLSLTASASGNTVTVTFPTGTTPPSGTSGWSLTLGAGSATAETPNTPSGQTVSFSNITGMTVGETVIATYTGSPSYTATGTVSS